MRALLLVAFLILVPGCVSHDVADDTLELRILTYNIHHGRGADGEIDLPRIAAVISAARPDLVALQEVDDSTQRSLGIDQTRELARLTGMHGVFGKAMDYQGGGYGEAVLSRTPLLASLAHPLPHEPRHEPRCALKVEVQPAGLSEPIAFIGTHLDHTRDPADRLAQARELNAAFAQSESGLTILAGDLNASPDSEPMRELLARWRDASAADPRPTFPSPIPLKRIDYVLLRGESGWRVVESRVIPEVEASDHRPLMVVLERGQ